MKLVINGIVRETPELHSIADLAAWLQLPAFGSAVELNGEVIRKADHPTTAMKEGDKLEIVRLVGGG